MGVRVCCCVKDAQKKPGSPRGAMGQEEEASPLLHKPHRLWGPANRNNVKGYEDTIRVRVTNTNMYVRARSAMDSAL